MDETYKAALDLWGAEAQTLMAMEEMSELQKELCKHARGKDNREEIAEEIADVRIMLDQMAILHDCEELAGKFKEQKIERLGKLIRRKKGAEEGQSNADRIRSMSDEEMAEWMTHHSVYSICDIVCGGDCRAVANLTMTSRERCDEIIMQWLKRPAEK